MGQQSLIYGFVARGTVILAEYTEFTGNFTGIAAQCLQKLTASNNKFTYNCDGHTFNYLVEDGFTYCVVSVESVGRQIPIAFLERVKEDFTKKYGGGKAATAVANSLNKEFGPKLKELMQYCVDEMRQWSRSARSNGKSIGLVPTMGYLHGKEPMIITSKDEMRQWSRSARSNGKSIGLVPTMGYLHDGHLSLIQESQKHTQHTVVSIYVNPGQFSPNEDLSTYPSDFLGDIKKLKEIGSVDVVFHPQNLYDYGQSSNGSVKSDGKTVSCVENSGMGHETWVRVEKLEEGLCGKSRPVFFRGVATIVAKLFNIVDPDIAVFGKKDYQQWRIIQRMVRDLDFDIKVIGANLVRDEDGLAKSSRNVHLSAQEREKALSISKSLLNAKFAAENGHVDCKELRDCVIKAIQEASGKVDYAEIVDQESLEALKEIKSPAVFCVAAWFGNVRLIDNIEINVR